MIIEMLNNPRKSDEGITVNIGNNPIFNSSIIKTMAKEDFRKESVEDIFNILRVSYTTVFEDLNKNVKSRFAGSFKNIKFLQALEMLFNDPVIGSQILEGNRILCNRMISDIVFNPNNYNAELAATAEKLAYIINKNIIDKIIGAFGETMRNATLIVVARYYSNNERDNIHLLNWLLVNTAKEDTPKGYLVRLYGILFDNIGLLFTDIMCSKINTNNPDTRYIKIYNLLADAILDILDTQPINIITAVLTQYNTDVKVILGGNIGLTRFPISSIINKYPRIGYVYNNLLMYGIVDVI